MMMNVVIVICIAALIIILLAIMRGHSQALQRFGVLELVLLLVVGTSILFGYMRSRDLMSDQYLELFSVHYGNAYNYLRDIEMKEEDHLYDTVVTQEDITELLNRILPVTTVKDERYRYLNTSVVKREGVNNYTESLFDGENPNFWNENKEEAVKLINESIRDKKVIIEETSQYRAIMVIADREAVAPVYSIVTEISLEPLYAELELLKRQYFVYSLIAMLIGSVLLIIVVTVQGREFRRVLKAIARVSEGRDSWQTLRMKNRKVLGMESNEMRSLYNSLWQLSTDVERMNYVRFQILQAYYRFAPKDIEKILDKESILDVEPMDRVSIERTLAFVSFTFDTDLPEPQYIRQMNSNYTLLGEIRKENDGIIISGNSDLSIIQLMFQEDIRKALHFGIELITRKMENHDGGQAFVLLHDTLFIYGVAGDEEQSFTYIHSNEMKILEKYVDDLRMMGVRMVVTDYVYQTIEREMETRYIGYIEDSGVKFNLYEILDAHSANERKRRIDLRPKFKKALNMFYKGDFYLARSVFSEILRDCSADEVAKWYLFLCEGCLNGEGGENPDFALLSKK